MVFETLHESSKKKELILVDGGLCHFHKRRDGQLTIREIIILPDRQNKGIGTEILEQLKSIQGVSSIFAKCPVDLPANVWYESKGFELENVETNKTGRQLNHWRLTLC